MASPLTAKDVEQGLAAAGFIRQPQKATAHVKWVKEPPPRKFVVMVDSHIAPFADKLVGYMAKEAGMSPKQFRELCSKEGVKAARSGSLSWLTKLYS